MADVDIWVDGEIITVDDSTINIPPPLPVPVPVPVISRKQIRLWLWGRDLLDLVEPLIESMPEPDRSFSKIEWQESIEFRHDHPLLQALAAAVGLTAEDIEAGFREASQL